jgi:hypothetical protein
MFQGVFMKNKYPEKKYLEKRGLRTPEYNFPCSKITTHQDKFAGFSNKAPEANELPMPPSHWSK